jgi:hypothetical protein
MGELAPYKFLLFEWAIFFLASFFVFFNVANEEHECIFVFFLVLHELEHISKMSMDLISAAEFHL